MINDFRPATSRAKSLSAVLNILPKEKHSFKTNFRTPEEVAASDDLTEKPQLPHDEMTEQLEQPWYHKLGIAWPPSKKQTIIGSAVIVVLAASVLGFALTHHAKKPVSALPALATTTPKTITAVKPTTVPSTLSGLPVAASVNTRPVTAVMVENSTFARPQSGLSQAGVVFEALAEGGVTRFMALYQDQAPASVGPIRSLRPYYLQWDLGFDGAIAHVGGSPQALSDVKAWGADDLDEFYNGASYQRISSRAAPHNVYTSIADLNQLEVKKGYITSSYTGFLRKADSPLKTPTARTIAMTLSSSTYNVSYVYNPTSNSYNRSEGGAPQTDQNTGAQLSPKVVIAIVVPYAQGALDASGAYYSDYSVTGSGQADVFQDGAVTVGTWTKATNTSQISFLDASGKAIALNAGQTWITAIVADNKVSYTP